MISIFINVHIVKILELRVRYSIPFTNKKEKKKKLKRKKFLQLKSVNAYYLKMVN